MSLSSFLQSLIEEGHVRVEPVFRNGRLVMESPAELNEAFEFLSKFEVTYQLELGHAPPKLDRDASLCGAVQVQRAASMLTYREFGPEQLQTAMAVRWPEPVSLSIVYSIDLTLRFLPDLVRLARAVSPQDPLVGILKEWAQHWPLSSVGISDIAVADSLTWLEDPCLRQIYVDRILSEQDESRLSDPRVLEAVRVAVGRQSQLVPRLAAMLSAK